MHSLCSDIIFHILDYLDHRTTKNLTSSCKNMNGLYRDNKSFIQKKMLHDMVHELGLDLSFNNLSHCKSVDSLYKQLSTLATYFKNHPRTYLSDYLVYIVEKKFQDKFLFRELCKLAQHKIYEHAIPSFSYQQIQTICTHAESRDFVFKSDITYMMIHGDIEISEILLATFLMSHTTIFEIVSRLLDFKTNETTDQIKILMCIKLYIYKFHFKTFSSSENKYFYMIFDQLIRFNKIQIIKGIFTIARKHNLYLNFSQLVQKCILYDNEVLLEYVHKQQILSNHPPSQYINPIITIVRPQDMKALFQQGSLRCLPYILEHMIGEFVNLPVYIENICSGLAANANIESDPTILFKYLDPQNTLHIKQLLDKRCI